MAKLQRAITSQQLHSPSYVSCNTHLQIQELFPFAVEQSYTVFWGFSKHIYLVAVVSLGKRAKLVYYSQKQKGTQQYFL